MNIHVGNLSRETAEADLRQAFEVFGKVSRANIITDRSTNQSKGFGFVEMADASEAQAAISGMAGKDLKGHALSVSEARGNSEAGIRRENGSSSDRNATHNSKKDSPESAAGTKDEPDEPVV